jgi:hypothetical protein
MEEVMNLFFDRRVLPIGTDSLLAVAPLEQSESAAIGAEVGGSAKQSPKSEPLLAYQMKGHDGSPRSEGSHGWARGSRRAVSSEFLDVLRKEAKNRGKDRSERG